MYFKGKFSSQTRGLYVISNLHSDAHFTRICILALTFIIFSSVCIESLYTSLRDEFFSETLYKDIEVEKGQTFKSIKYRTFAKVCIWF